MKWEPKYVGFVRGRHRGRENGEVFIKRNPWHEWPNKTLGSWEVRMLTIEIARTGNFSTRCIGHFRSIEKAREAIANAGIPAIYIRDETP